MNYSMKQKQGVSILHLLLLPIVFEHLPCYCVFVHCFIHPIPPHCLAFQRQGTTLFPQHPPTTTATQRLQNHKVEPHHGTTVRIFMPDPSQSSCHDGTNDGGGTSIESDDAFTSNTATTASVVFPNNESIVAAIEFANLVGQLKITPRTGWKRRKIVPCESVADHSWRVAILAYLLLSPSNESNHNDDNTTTDTATNEKSVGNDNNFDLNKVIQMALIHDVAECIIGDITPEDNVSKSDKHQLEYNAMQHITQLLHTAVAACTITTTSTTTTTKSIDTTTTSNNSGVAPLLPGKQSNLAENILMKLFNEYEGRQSIESIIVKDLDLLDMILQANTYEIQYTNSDNEEPSAIDDLSDFFIGTPSSKFRIPKIRQMAEYIHTQRKERIQMIQSHNNDTTTIPTTKDEGVKPGDHPAHQSNIQSDLSSHEIDTMALSQSDLAFIAEYSHQVMGEQSSSPLKPMIEDDVTTSTTTTRVLVAATVHALRQWEDRTKQKSV